MRFTHGDFEIEIGLAQKTTDETIIVEWALFRLPHGMGDEPARRGMTITYGDPDIAEAMACADCRNAANELE